MNNIEEIVAWFNTLGREVISGKSVNSSTLISSPKAISKAAENNISFINSKLSNEAVQLLRNTNCKLIVIEKRLWDTLLPANTYDSKVIIISTNPKLDIMQLYKEVLRNKLQSDNPNIHPSASIDSEVILGTNVKIGANTVIEGNATIGNNSSIGACSVIKSDTIIGADTQIGSGNVIGGDGFGYVKNETTGIYEHFPHLGQTIIGDRVHIGNNNCIDRGSLDDTVICDDVKIDNLVHIAHNVYIGKNALIIACSMIAGSVEIGKNAWIAPSATIRNGISIGPDATLGLGSVLTKSIPEGEIYTGSPAMPLESFKNLRKHQNEVLSELKNPTKS